MNNNGNLTKAESFDKLMENYNVAKAHFESLPKNKPTPGVKFDQKAYQASEAARVKMDFALAAVTEVKKDVIDFLTVNKDGSTTIMFYNPFGSFLDNLEEMTFEYVEVPDKKTKVYSKASNHSIRWFIRVLSGDINLLFAFKLKKWITERTRENEDFCKDISRIIRFYPHKDMKNNEDYLAAFFQWFNTFEKDEMVRMNVLDGVMEELKMCFFQDKREKYEKDGTLEDEIRLFSPTLFIQDCSKKCHERFIKLRLGSEEKKSFLDLIRSKGLERKSNLEAMLNGKRKRDELDVGGNEAGENKKRKIEEDAVVLADSFLDTSDE